MNLPHPLEHPTIDVPTAAQALGVSRSVGFAMANEYLSTDGASGLPVLRCGRKLRVPTAALWRLLGLDPSSPGIAAKRTASLNPGDTNAEAWTASIVAAHASAPLAPVVALRRGEPRPGLGPA